MAENLTISEKEILEALVELDGWCRRRELIPETRFGNHRLKIDLPSLTEKGYAEEKIGTHQGSGYKYRASEKGKQEITGWMVELPE